MSSARILNRIDVINDAIIPGRGKLFGLDPKHDLFTPLDFVPFLGPLNKINKGRKLLKLKKLKILLLGLGTLAVDIYTLNSGIKYIREQAAKGSGAPLASTKSAPKKAIKANAGSNNSMKSCPKGYRWDGKQGKCVRFRRKR